jgi:hypothetical protein
MPASPASAAPAGIENDKPIEIIMACDAGRISIGSAPPMPAWPPSAAPAGIDNDEPIEIIIACEAGRISIG